MTRLEGDKFRLDLASAAPGKDNPYLSGKDRGIDARKFFKLDALEDMANSAEVIIPDYIKGISSSYSLGLFSESVSKLGSLDAFLQKYTFVGKLEIVESIINALKRGELGPPQLN